MIFKKLKNQDQMQTCTLWVTETTASLSGPVLATPRAFRSARAHGEAIQATEESSIYPGPP